MIFPYNCQYTDNDDIKIINQLFVNNNFLTCGPKIDQFEKKISEFTNIPYSVAVSNGTAALHLACLVANIKNGDNVIVPAISFCASSNCVLYCNGKPIFCDVESETLNIDPNKLKEILVNDIEKKIKVLICVDMGGQLCNYKKIIPLCIKYNLFLIVDGAHSFGVNNQDLLKEKNLSYLITSSFHPIKNITTGEGGIILTNNEQHYKLLKKYRSHGMDRNFSDRDSSEEIKGYEYNIDVLGYNYRMCDIQACLGITQLDKLNMFMEKRELLKNYYLKKIKENFSEKIIQPLEYKFNSANHLFIIRVKNNKRDFLYKELKKFDIITNVNYKPIYLFDYYINKLGYKKGLCVEAENVYKEILSLPIYYKLELKDIDYILSKIKIILNDNI